MTSMMLPYYGGGGWKTSSTARGGEQNRETSTSEPTHKFGWETTKKKIIASFVTQGGVCTREPNPLVERMQIDSYCRKIGAYGGANECEWRKTRPGWSLHSRVTMDVLETSITMTSDERCQSESEIDWRQSTCVTFLL